MGLSPGPNPLLGDPIDSVEALELLFLLRRSPDTFWTAGAASQKLGIRADLASRKLSRLVEAKLLVRGRDTGAYRYAPATDDWRKLVDDLAAEYEERSIGVINAIYSANLERLRAFSDAFRLKKE